MSTGITGLISRGTIAFRRRFIPFLTFECRVLLGHVSAKQSQRLVDMELAGKVMQAKPFVRRQGAGPAVFCLHSSLSSSKQWQPLMDELDGTHEVLAPDLYGYGQSPAWPAKGMLTLADEVDFLLPVINTIAGSVHLVGHSFGAAVALSIALQQPERVKSMVIYEPVLFSLLFDSVPTRPGSDEIWRVQAEVRRLVMMKRLEDAAEHFVDYWSEKGAWQTFPDFRRQSVAERMPQVVADFEAILTSSLTLRDYAKLQMPMLILHGKASPVSSRHVASLLAEAIPNARLHGIEKLGHMGPVTHADEVNRVIIEFLRSQ